MSCCMHFDLCECCTITKLFRKKVWRNWWRGSSNQQSVVSIQPLTEPRSRNKNFYTRGGEANGFHPDNLSNAPFPPFLRVSRVSSSSRMLKSLLHSHGKTQNFPRPRSPRQTQATQEPLF